MASCGHPTHAGARRGVPAHCAGTPPPTTLSPAEIEMQKLLSVAHCNHGVASGGFTGAAKAVASSLLAALRSHRIVSTAKASLGLRLFR